MGIYSERGLRKGQRREIARVVLFFFCNKKKAKMGTKLVGYSDQAPSRAMIGEAALKHHEDYVEIPAHKSPKRVPRGARIST